MRDPLLFLSSLVAAVGCGPCLTAQKDQAEFFGLEKCWDVHLTVQAADLDKMYPKGSSRMGLSQGKGHYPYVPADVAIGAHRCAKIGLRFKGNSTYWMTSGTLKKSFKLDFNRYVRGRRFLGLTKLNLQNNATDPTQVREAVSYEVYRAMGVPACRVAFARVYLTVVGRFEKEYVGNYTVVEQIDKRFVRRNFPGDKSGLLLKPEGRTNVFLGETWSEDYANVYHPKTDVEPERTKPLIGLMALLQKSDAELHANVESVLDVSEFLNYCACTAFLANLDSPFMLAHNYFLVVPEKLNKVVWIPWDLNLSLGGFTMAGSRQEQLSVMEPTKMALFQRLLQAPRFKKIYRDHLWRLVRGVGAPQTLAGLVAKARATTKAGIAQEKERSDAIQSGGRGGGNMFGRLAAGMFRGTNLDDFVARRAPHVIDQLEGRAKGNPARTGMMMGGFGRNGAARGPRSVMEVLRDSLMRGVALPLSGKVTSKAALLAAGDTFFNGMDRDEDNLVTRREIAVRLRRLRGQDASSSEARRLLKAFDTDKNRRLSRTEWQAACSRGFAEWDADQDGKLSAAELRGR